MDIQRTGGLVRIWWEDRYVKSYDDDAAPVEHHPDIVMSEGQANTLIVELLRGPMGTAGPQGPMGIAGRDANGSRE